MTDESTGLSTQDAKLIAAATADGRISDPLVWIDAIKADPQGTRRVLASLPKAWTRMRTVAASTPITINTPPQSVAAASPEAIANERAVLDSVGLRLPDAPRAHVISKGKDPQTWTKEEQYRYFAHKLGGRLAIGVPKPPAGDQIYIDSPTAPYRWDAASQQFVERNPYREIPND
jgi:hypothetical protein